MSTVDPDAVLGNQLHTARIAAGLTLEAAARASGVSHSRLAGLEQGDGLLIVADIVPLLRAYRTTLAVFGAAYERALGCSEESQS
ncbi:MAG TPA: helix-turn-helix transcriptional regulator [Propionicimonas sp.]|jgi:transcriptional regulator with XRE-family HTH domain